MVNFWIEHTYPVDADPAKDPTKVVVDGFTYSLGQLHAARQVLEGEPEAKLPSSHTEQRSCK